MDLYTEEVIQHAEHPQNRGELTGEYVISEQEINASCGDSVQFYIRLRVNAKTRQREIADVKWSGAGCAITTASASKLSEYLRGSSLQVIKGMSEEELLRKAVGFAVNPGRIKCLMLPVKVVKKLLAHTPKT